MDGGALLPEAIVATLARGATVLTGNQRAARTLHYQFDLHNRALGLPSWAPPAILAWDVWIASLWHRLLVDGYANLLLLNRPQEHALWRSIIAADPEWSSLRTSDSLAEMASDAWSHLAAYRGEGHLRSAGVSADTRAFQRWAIAFERRCRAEGYLSQSQMESILETEVSAGHVTFSDRGYVLVGFDGMTPAQLSVVEALRATGISVEELELHAPDRSKALVAAETEHEELTLCARWARRHLEEHPKARIALIVPDLEDRRAVIDRVLLHTLAPELEDITAKQATTPFEFSLGIPLARTPIVATALDLLHWTFQPLTIDRISHLLLSPYFAGGVEINARAEFDAYELRRARMLRPEMTLDDMIHAVEAARRSQRLPRLITALKAMRRVIAAEGFAASDLRPSADCAEAIHALLEAAGWSGGDDSIEFQTRRKWESLLDELATLDFEGIRISFHDALATVQRLAQNTLFAPESRGASVQIMGPLESAGSVFDAAWFLRAGDLIWPQRPGTTPLLPWHLQRELAMPGTDPAADSGQARRTTERIAHSAPIVVFSYAKDSVDGLQRPSTALADLSLHDADIQHLAPATPPREVVPLEIVEDGSTLPPIPDQVIRGGADILRLQAACGFRAFAEKRLWATGLDSTEPGMDARERGSSVHVVLEHFWREVKTQAALKALSTVERRAVLSRAIETALEKTDRLSISSWDAAYMDIQRERLVALLDPWLLAEMKRSVPFTVKLSETELKDAHIGPLRLRLRVDRIDETEFGDVILDYKTGDASPSAWLTERPDEPQLPLYAVLSESTDIAGVAFAKVRVGKDMELHGYETQSGILLKSAKLKDAPTLEDQVEQWRRVLTSLAEDFHGGDIRVRPKKYPTTCEYCTQRLLCRLDISQLEDNTDDESEAETDRG
ncbi:PD-(D/E)XK nuclease family protein [Granulicella arctica]|uniref:Putative DNA repair protein n=1 Tax=Granulicella arctica TaxID=940613 RepID=A0A7Y9PIM1_9BACT|nr:PD-(D/E)XK nuclease family protein [Granulicella arctica]NYF80445.1 putative DNA repair protein [Granulicella arctica]